MRDARTSIGWWTEQTPVTTSFKSRRGGLPPLLKAFTAEDRASLCGLEWHRGFLAARRTNRAGFDPEMAALSCRCCPQYRHPLRLAGLAPLGFVLELLVVEKQLFPSRKDEVRAAVNALQCLVLKFH